MEKITIINLNEEEDGKITVNQGTMSPEEISDMLLEAEESSIKLLKIIAVLVDGDYEKYVRYIEGGLEYMSQDEDVRSDAELSLFHSMCCTLMDARKDEVWNMFYEDKGEEKDE